MRLARESSCGGDRPFWQELHLIQTGCALLLDQAKTIPTFLNIDHCPDESLRNCLGKRRDGVPMGEYLNSFGQREYALI